MASVRATLFLITFMLIAQCLNWNLLSMSLPKFIASMLVIAAAGWWFMRRFYPEGFDKPLQLWTLPTVEEGATMLTASVAAMLLGLRGLSIARHETSGNPAAKEPYDVTDPFIGSRVPRLGEVPQALNWFFWQRGKLYSAGGAIWLALLMGLATFLARKELFRNGPDLESIRAMSLFIPMMICTLIGVALGLDVRHLVRFSLMPFLSTRPVTTRQLSHSLLWNALKSTLTAWAILVAAVVVCGTGFFLKTSPAELLAEARRTHNGIAEIPLWLAFSFLLSWIGLSWMAVLGWSGREKVMIVGIFLLIGLPVIYRVFVLFVVPRGGQEFFFRFGAWLPAILIPLALVDFTVSARRAEFMTSETLFLILVLAVALAGFALVVPVADAEERTLFYLYSLAAILPIPATPLMLAWNRHR